MFNTVAIIGAGPFGRWLALVAARAGYRVLLEDLMPASLHHAQEYLREQLGPQALAAELSGPVGMDPENMPATSGHRTQGVEFVLTIEDAVRSADLAIDCVPDELESKLEILWLLDRMAPPQTILATPTTRLSISDLAACTYRAGQCVAITMEPSALAFLHYGAEIPLRSTNLTTQETLAKVEEFWRRLGFVPRFAVDGG